MVGLACLLAFSFVSVAAAGDEAGNLGFDEKFLVMPGFGGPFSEGLMSFREANYEARYGFIDANGRQIIAPMFTNPAAFHEGLAAVGTETAKCGYIDSGGRFIIPPVFDYCQDFYLGKAIVSLGNQMQIINKQGEFLLPKAYGSVFFDANIEKYLCIEYTAPNKTDIYNNDLGLERSYPCRFLEFCQLAGKTVGVSYESTGKARVFDYNANDTISLNTFPDNDYFVYIEEENDLIIAVNLQERVMFVYDEEGNLLLQTEGNDITPLSRELFFVKDRISGKECLLTPSSKQEVSFDIQGKLAPGLFLLSKVAGTENFLYGAVDSAGNEVIPADYSEIYSFPDSFIYAKKGSTLDVYSSTGKFLRQFEKVAALFPPGPDSVVYQDEAGFLHFLDGAANEYYAAQLPGLENFSMISENTYYAAANGQFYIILDKKKFDPQIPEYSMAPVKELDLKKITKDTAVYFMLDNFKKAVNGVYSILNYIDHVPLLIEDSTLMPLESLNACFNGAVYGNWNYTDNTAEIKFLDRVLTLTAGSHNAELKYFDSDRNQYVTESQTIASSMRLIEDTTFVPLRAVAEIFGFHVYWHDSGLIGLSNYPLQPTEQEVQQLLAGFADHQATPRELQKMDASLATQPYLDFISTKLTGITDVYKIIAIYSNTIPAYEALIAKIKDLILVTEPSPDILNLAQENGVELALVPFAKEGFVFLVNQENPVDSLAEQQLRDIYQGKITNWLEVGGLDAPIEAYQRNENSGSQTIMENNFMQGLPLIEPIMGQRIMSMEGLIDVVAEYREEVNAALGYSVYYYAREMYDSEQTKLLQVNSVAPSTETIRSGEYPLIVNYYAVTRKDDTSASTQKLLDFILSSEGQTCVNESGLVSVR